MPLLGAVTTSPDANGTRPTASFSHTNEIATPGYYSVRLDSGIGISLATTLRTGIGMFTYPATTTASLLIAAGGSANGDSASSVHIDNQNGVVTGSAASGGFCGSPFSAYTVYFAAQFNRPFAAYGTWNGTTNAPRSSDDAGKDVGAFVTFDTMTDATVVVKVGLSFVSAQNALLNLGSEDAGWDVGVVRDAATTAWDILLGRVQVQGGTSADTRTFYTALYHSLLFPSVFSDSNGEYIGFDGTVHTAQGYTQYANYSGWDIYRTEVPLLALIAPRQTGDMMQSLVADAQQGVRLPLWALANTNATIQNGDPADCILAGAYAFGARHFDVVAALHAVLAGATMATSDESIETKRAGLTDYLKLG